MVYFEFVVDEWEAAEDSSGFGSAVVDIDFLQSGDAVAEEDRIKGVVVGIHQHFFMPAIDQTNLVAPAFALVESERERIDFLRAVVVKIDSVVLEIEHENLVVHIENRVVNRLQKQRLRLAFQAHRTEHPDVKHEVAALLPSDVLKQRGVDWTVTAANVVIIQLLVASSVFVGDDHLVGSSRNMLVDVVELVFSDAHGEHNSHFFAALHQSADPINRVLAHDVNLVVNILVKTIEFPWKIDFSYGVEIERKVQQRVASQAVGKYIDSHVINLKIGNADHFVVIGNVRDRGGDCNLGCGEEHFDVVLGGGAKRK